MEWARFIRSRFDPLRVDKRVITETLGTKGMEWTYCPDGIDEKSVVYSFGVGTDLSFEKAFIEKHGSEIHGFDFTPKSIAWARAQSLPTQYAFHEFGISDKDGPVAVFPPVDPSHVSYSIVPRGVDPASVAHFDAYRLSTIMKRFGHARLDLLKLDVEGMEFKVIDDFLDEKIAVKQFLVEFHHRFEGLGEERLRSTLKRLRKAGYRIFAVSGNREEVSFIRG